MKRIVLLLAIGAMPALPAWAQARQGPKGGDVEAGIATLNLFEKRPEAVNQVYRLAYEILAKDKKASFADLARDEAFQRACREAGITHLGGPMLGSVTSDGVRVWVRTLKPAEVEVRVTVEGEERSFGPISSTFESDLAAVVLVSGLEPSGSYPYRVIIDGEPVSIPEHSAIVTAPEPETTGKVRIAFGSCFHRWGIGNRKQADLVRSRNPAAMLLIGDIAVQDRKNDLGMHRADYLLRDFHATWQDLVATVPVYATWDDHDYFSNDGAGVPRGFTPEDRAGVVEVFRQAWNNPSYGFGDERGGVFLRTRIGPCDVIMVDNRYFRENKPGSFLGDGQMEWLKEQLLDCKGPFIVMSCGTMWSDYVSNGKDSWGRWDPDGREEIFTLIEDNRIGGVLLISGDRHGARGFRIPRPGGLEFYEFEPASLGGRSGPAAASPKWETQLFGISRRYAFGEFTFDADLPDPEVTFRLIGDDGTVIHELELKRSRLTPKGDR